MVGFSHISQLGGKNKLIDESQINTRFLLINLIVILFLMGLLVFPWRHRFRLWESGSAGYKEAHTENWRLVRLGRLFANNHCELKKGIIPFTMDLL